MEHSHTKSKADPSKEKVNTYFFYLFFQTGSSTVQFCRTPMPYYGECLVHYQASSTSTRNPREKNCSCRIPFHSTIFLFSRVVSSITWILSSKNWDEDDFNETWRWPSGVEQGVSKARDGIWLGSSSSLGLGTGLLGWLSADPISSSALRRLSVRLRRSPWHI